jgi:hypothetical protein
MASAASSTVVGAVADEDLLVAEARQMADLSPLAPAAWRPKTSSPGSSGSVNQVGRLKALANARFGPSPGRPPEAAVRAKDEAM